MSQREIERVFELLNLPVASDPIGPNKIPGDAGPPPHQRVVFIAAESTSRVIDPEVHAKLERDSQRDQSRR